MCGIVGMLDMNNEGRINETIICNMTQKIRHRGPDGLNYFVKDNVGFGFARLSIIDLEGEIQPFFNEDYSIVMICNGEIYNYKELCEDLHLKGHKLRTNCDVECIVHLYEEYGAECINKLNGQFAFAIYDFKEETLLCARDYAGIAPFFYTVVDNMFIFASEIKAILEYPAVKREIDLVGLDQILTFPGLISPRTMFKDISSLKAGHYIKINHFGNMKMNEYWDLVYPKIDEIEYRKDETFYIEQLDEWLSRAVKYRLQADVPVSFYLSGGLDSSIIAAKINKIDPTRRHSFSIDFTDKEISESKYQRLMSQHVNSMHHEYLFRFYDIEQELRKVVYHSECALKETYNTASIKLSNLVKQYGLKVVLTGEGADELFGGYIGYRFDKLKQMQGQQATANDGIEDHVRESIWGDKSFLYEKNYFSFQQIKQDLYSDDVNRMYEDVNCLNHFIVNKERLRNVDVLHKRSYVDFKLRMSDHLLSDHGDRMTFANSVEARYPFLDKGLIEFATKIPPSLKLKEFEEKYILKKVSEGLIPTDIAKRPKFAFTAPGSPELLKQNIEWINDLLSYDRIKKQGLFRPEKIEQLKNSYSQPDFRLNVPYDNDFLITVITVGLLMEEYNMKGL
ncbi:asparagine synthase (glutamine-hydrolyzing) [Bacillus chungangensis]|uniref:asparagine synthase (glutamine-hydrolyzing) n=1 Tax=Bacillus chungangensis TaxID=587633 RepID=A0ABT9WQ92_9BACI|nr:asparagine synthase (glutamine-hydrolyzing) [Bacillus chungangensis]MDQ0175264.1 asparagine synthase (glutamine-hydrolyzing) [Bacillus chungangensis]